MSGASGASDGGRGERARRLAEIHDVVGSLREPVPTPDLTEAILDRVGRARPFSDRSARRWRMVHRLTVAASVGMVALGVALLHRAAPGVVTLTVQPSPLSDVVESAKGEAFATLGQVRTTIVSVRAAAELEGVRAVVQSIEPIVIRPVMSEPSLIGPSAGGVCVEAVSVPRIVRLGYGEALTASREVVSPGAPGTGYLADARTALSPVKAPFLHVKTSWSRGMCGAKAGGARGVEAVQLGVDRGIGRAGMVR